MVRRSLFIAGMLLALGSIAATASAQPGGGGGGMGGMFGGLFGGGAGATVTNLMLLRMPTVQTELSLTSGQQTQINDLLTESTQNIRDSMGQINFQDLMNATQEERQKMMDDIRKKVEDGTKGLDDKVGTILNPTQSKRLNELRLQRMGAAALILPETVKSLGLNNDQVTKIKGIISSATNAFTPPTFDPNQSPEDRQTAMQDLRKKMQDQTAKTQKDCLAVLTDDQSLTWANLCGKTFTFPANGGFGGGRGGRGGGGGFGGGGGPGGQ